MATDSIHTSELQRLVDLIRLDDRAAENELILRSGMKLYELAQLMMNRFPLVRRWEAVDDVVQESTLNLLKALRNVRPENMKGYYRLAASKIRLELLTLARRYRGPTNHAAHHDSNSNGTSGLCLDDAPDPEDVRNLDRWTAFHEAIGTLPEHLRDVVELRFYEQMNHREIAKELDIDSDKVKEYLEYAGKSLIARLGHEIPEW